MIPDKDTISISKFKATCLAVLERVRQTGRPVLVTRFGKPVAEVVPPPALPHPDDWLGSMRSSARIAGDIVAPVMDEHHWDVTRS